MTYEILLAFAVFAFVSSITPGPNNLMIMASGANFGVRLSLPHLAGIALGFGAMILLVGLGLAQVFETFPWLRTVLAIVSVAYLLWLAWKIAGSAPPDTADPDVQARPFTFLQAALFQWVNPKAWTMALTAVTLYAVGGAGSVPLVTAVFIAIGFPAMFAWLMLGVQMRRFLTSPARLRAFNWTMAGLLVLSLVPTLSPLLQV